MHYRIRYTEDGLNLAETILAETPVAAIDSFHTLMQLERLKEPQGYKLTSMASIYNADAMGSTKSAQVESQFDLPKTKNPTIQPKIKKVPSTPTEAMPFMAELGKGRLAQ